jgi:hypothetical protein
MGVFSASERETFERIAAALEDCAEHLKMMAIPIQRVTYNAVPKPQPQTIMAKLSTFGSSITCEVFHKDRSGKKPLYVSMRSMRGAQREITGRLIEDGYEPDGEWEGTETETIRRFKR